MFYLRKATTSDNDDIIEMLKKAGLPIEGIEQSNVHFWIIEHRNKKAKLLKISFGHKNPIIGVVGLEVHSSYGLLRSFVWKKASWRVVATQKTLQLLLRHAHKLKLTHVYLLAGQESSVLKNIGFTPITVDEVPELIRTSDHFMRTGMLGIPMVYAC